MIVGMIILTSLMLTQKSFGSVNDSSAAYESTTTRSAVLGVPLTSPTTLSLGFGTLGSVIITGANTGITYIYDATSTNAHSDYVGTTTLAIIPASMAAGTYVFDVKYTRGLVIETIGGLVASSTITWKK